MIHDNIPHNAIKQTIDDFVSVPNSVDLIIVMGTSLQVAPFCGIPNLVSKSCTRVLVDINPENTFTNKWSYKKSRLDGMYSLPSSKSTINFGSRNVSLRPQWGKHSKWKDQHIIKCDCDDWSQSILSVENTIIK